MARCRLQALPVLLFPVFLAIGIGLIPVVDDFFDHNTVVETLASSPDRWAWGLIVTAGAFGLGVVTVWSASERLRETEGTRWASLAVPVAAIGAALHATGLGADGIGPVAVHESGGSAQAFFEGNTPWVPVLTAIGTILLSAPLFALAVAARSADLISKRWGIVSRASAVAFVTAGAIPTGYALYAVAAAGFGATLPLGVAMWHRADARGSSPHEACDP